MAVNIDTPPAYNRAGGVFYVQIPSALGLCFISFWIGVADRFVVGGWISGPFPWVQLFGRRFFHRQKKVGITLSVAEYSAVITRNKE